MLCKVYFSCLPVVYWVCLTVLHCSSILWLSVKAWGWAHPRSNLRRHVAHIRAHIGTHVGTHVRAIRTCTHLAMRHPSRRHARIQWPSSLSRHRVQGSTHARTWVTGIRHATVPRLPRETWRRRRQYVIWYQLCLETLSRPPKQCLHFLLNLYDKLNCKANIQKLYYWNNMIENYY